MRKNLGTPFFGGTCFLCRGAASAILCAACDADLPRLPAELCPRCALGSPRSAVCGRCLAQPPSFDATLAALLYAFPADAMVHALKFRSELALAPLMAALLANQIPRHPVDCVIGVPLSPERLRERGYNQAVEIARTLASKARAPLELALCERARDTPAQTDLPWAERERNMRGAFRCPRPLIGARVAVVDDVMTTGATLSEVAATLKRAGASQVVNWVVARTFPRRRCSTSSSSHPEIPPNTGNVIRLAANTGCSLHLVEPLGFSMDDKQLKRARASTITRCAQVRRHAAGTRMRRSALAAGACSRSPPRATRSFADVGLRRRRRARVRRRDRRLARSVLAGFPMSSACGCRCARAIAASTCPTRSAVVVFEAWRQLASPAAAERSLAPGRATEGSSTAPAAAEPALEHRDDRVRDRHLDAERGGEARSSRARAHAFGDMAEPGKDLRQRLPARQLAGRRGGCATGRRWRSARGRPAPAGP